MNRISVAAKLIRAFSLVLPAVFLLALASALTGCGGGIAASREQSLAITGIVHGGQQPVTGSLIQLYVAGTTGDASAASPLLAARATTSDGTGDAGNSNANAANQSNQLAAGSFTLTGAYTCPTTDAQVYLVATVGNPGSALARPTPRTPCSPFLAVAETSPPAATWSSMS